MSARAAVVLFRDLRVHELAAEAAPRRGRDHRERIVDHVAAATAFRGHRRRP